MGALLLTIIIAHSKHEVFLVLLVKFHACFLYFAFYNFEVLFVFSPLK